MVPKKRSGINHSAIPCSDERRGETMRKHTVISIRITIILMLQCGLSLYADVDYVLNPVTVTASRLSSPRTGQLREVLILDADRLQKMPGENILDKLRYAGLLTVRRRGIGGVQADFSVRGCTFEQVTVMVDGVCINDLQTGHHNGDIPVPLSEIRCIEIMPGHASPMYGSSAFGGVIHILTRPVSRTETRIGLSAGSYGTVGADAVQEWRTGSGGHRIHAGIRSSRGYHYDTDYRTWSAGYTFQQESRTCRMNARIDYMDKNFGANGFYADFPSREETSTWLANIQLSWQPQPFFSIRSSIFGRMHRDDFILDCNQPMLHQSCHEKQGSGVTIHANRSLSGKAELVAGGEWRHDRLSGRVMGNHGISRWALFSEIGWQVHSRILFNAECRLDYQDLWGSQWNPAAGIGWRIARDINWHFSAGRIFRAPNMTELYYRSPANHGNPELAPEYGWSLESEWRQILSNDKRFSLAIFYRSESDGIDWMRENTGEPWQAFNMGQRLVTGITGMIHLPVFSLGSVQTVYTLMDQRCAHDLKNSYKYKYSMYRQQLQISVLCREIGKITPLVILQMKHKESEKPFWLMDIKCSRDFFRGSLSLGLYNLFNTDYEEIPGVPMPGRHILLEWRRHGLFSRQDGNR